MHKLEGRWTVRGLARHAGSILNTQKAACHGDANWLSGIKMNLSDEQSMAVLGDNFTLTIPCGTIDL